MSNLIRFFKNPSEEKSGKRADVILAIIFYFVIPPFVSIALSSLFDHFSFSHINGTFRNNSPDLCRLIISVMLEELAFRLPLKDKKINKGLSSFALAILMARMFIPHSCTWTMIIVLMLIFTIVSYVIQCAMYKYLNYRAIFYFFCLSFGLLHIVNLNFDGFCVASLLYGLIYCVDKIIGGALLGYIRVQTNIIGVIIIHYLYDILPFIIEYILSTICKI